MDGWMRKAALEKTLPVGRLARKVCWLLFVAGCNSLECRAETLFEWATSLSLSLLENQRTRSDWKVQALIPQYLLPRRSHRQFPFIISLIFSDVSQIERINKHPSLESIDPRQLTRVCVQVTGHGKRLRRPLVQDDLIDRLFRRRGPPLY